MRESFEFREPRNPEAGSPERFRELAGQEAQRIRWESLDPVAQEIAGKILLKLDLKEHLEEVDRHKDDPAVYQELKRLGLFLVFDRKSQHKWEDENSDFNLKKGDHYLDLHLPPIPENERENLLAKSRASFSLIADYIRRNKLKPKYIMGVTYERLASVSKGLGFHLIEPSLPEDVRRGVENVYRDFVAEEESEQEGGKQKRQRSIGKILVCYQGLKEFMDRYGE